MDYIKSWLKTILYMDILLLLCDNLMSRTAYEKYYRFFSGFLLALCLLKPVIDLSNAGTLFQNSFFQNELKSELQLIKKTGDFGKMEETIKEEYEAACKKQIEETALTYGITATEISLRWSSNGGELKEITVKGEREKNSEKAQTETFRETLMQFYNLDSSHINIEVEG